MKKILLIALLILPASLLYAQNGARAEKIQALKIAFITQRLQLTPEEAKGFWPVYNQYETEIRKQGRTKDAIENEEQLLNIRKKYKPTFEKVLGAEKANNFFIAEADFRKVLIKRLKTERGN